MKANPALSLVEKLDKDSGSKLFVEASVIDDNSSIRALLYHDMSIKETGKDKLPLHISELMCGLLICLTAHK